MVNTKFVFPYQLHQMLEDAEVHGFDHIVSWLPNSRDHFKVHDIHSFEKDIMTTYFQTMTRYKSFLRQLNIYGFTREVNSGKDRGAYTHPLMIRHDVQLCSQMVRTKIKKISFKKMITTMNKMNSSAAPSTSSYPSSMMDNFFNTTTMRQDKEPLVTSLTPMKRNPTITLSNTEEESLKSQIKTLMNQLEHCQQQAVVHPMATVVALDAEEKQRPTTAPVLIEELEEDDVCDVVDFRLQDEPADCISTQMANDIIAILGGF